MTADLFDWSSEIEYVPWPNAPTHAGFVNDRREPRHRLTTERTDAGTVVTCDCGRFEVTHVYS